MQKLNNFVEIDERRKGSRRMAYESLRRRAEI
jgi:hypothetical protein